MLKNYITSTIRSVRRQKAFSAINILGLSVGISVSLMLYLFIQHELSYDRFHTKGDRVHRLISEMTMNNGNVWTSAISFGTMGPKIEQEVPEVEHATRILRGGRVDILYNENAYLSRDLLFTEHSFFEVFSFPSIYNRKVDQTAYESGGIVISEKTALEIFGTIPQLGEDLVIDGKTYPLIDVLSIPKTSHLQFDILLASDTYEDWEDLAVNSGLEFWTYLLYREGVDVSNTHDKVSAVYNEEMSQRFSNFASNFNNWVQPLGLIHLYSDRIGTSPPGGSYKTIQILAVLDALILLIAVVNFINLTTAGYEKRIKEIGVRKVLGANKQHLVRQFLSESVLLTLFAFALALGLTQALIQPFGELLEIEASTTYWQAPLQLLTILGAALVLGLMAGIYPAFFISGFAPTRILKKQFFNFKGQNRSTKVLVIFQFIIAIMLLINLAFFNAQLRYVKNKDLGFNKEHVLVVNNLTNKLKENFSTIESRLSQNPNVVSYSGTQGVPGSGTSGQTIRLDGADPKSSISIAETRTQYGYLNTFEIPLVKGRDFSRDIASDKNGFIINEAAVNALFPDGRDPINEIVQVANRRGPILGVMKDHHFRSLKQEIRPLTISLDDPYRLLLAARIRESDMMATVEQIGDILTEIDPNYSLGYFFLDESLARQYQSEEKYQKIISWSSLLAALISLVGLVALTSFSIAKKTKEVAIRKVLGAHFQNLTWVLTKEFYWVLLIANVIAIPAAILVVNNWLSDFAYRIQISDHLALFILIVGASFVVTFSLILTEVIRKVRTNPAEVLANE